MERLAKITHMTLKRIIVGSVLRVDVQMRATLEMMAKIYSHQNCFPKSRPGKIIAIFVEKPHASTVLTLFQYLRLDMVLIASMIFLKNIILLNIRLVFCAFFGKE